MSSNLVEPLSSATYTNPSIIQAIPSDDNVKLFQLTWPKSEELLV